MVSCVLLCRKHNSFFYCIQDDYHLMIISKLEKYAVFEIPDGSRTVQSILHQIFWRAEGKKYVFWLWSYRW